MQLLSKSICRMIKVVMLTLLGVQFITPAMASVRDDDFTCRTPVNEAVLDSMRGGFQRDPDGPFMSFGFERNVFLNEKLIHSMGFDIPDMKRFSEHRDFNPFADHRDMKPLADNSDMRPFVNQPSETFTLIQTGPGNSVPPDLSAMPSMTVIQNSLDGQAIKSETVLNATVEALSWARSLALGDALSQATIDTIRH